MSTIRAKEIERNGNAPDDQDRLRPGCNGPKLTRLISCYRRRPGLFVLIRVEVCSMPSEEGRARLVRHDAYSSIGYWTRRYR